MLDIVTIKQFTLYILFAPEANCCAIEVTDSNTEPGKDIYDCKEEIPFCCFHIYSKCCIKHIVTFLIHYCGVRK